MRSVRRSSQTGSISQSGHQQNRSIEFSQSLYQATPGPNLGELDTSINNATIDGKSNLRKQAIITGNFIITKLS